MCREVVAASGKSSWKASKSPWSSVTRTWRSSKRRTSLTSQGWGGEAFLARARCFQEDLARSEEVGGIRKGLI